MRAGESNERRHSTCTHSAECTLAASVITGSVKIGKDGIKFPNHLLNHTQGLLRRLSRLIKALPVPGQINGAGGDARPCKSQVATGVEFLGDGASVHPHQYWSRAQDFPSVAIKVRMHHQRGYGAVGKPQPTREGQDT